MQDNPMIMKSKIPNKINLFESPFHPLKNDVSENISSLSPKGSIKEINTKVSLCFLPWSFLNPKEGGKILDNLIDGPFHTKSSRKNQICRFGGYFLLLRLNSWNFFFSRPKGLPRFTKAVHCWCNFLYQYHYKKTKKTILFAWTLHVISNKSYSLSYKESK